ncbi:hypothetical protein [Polyangium jinanense]|uniref:Uncharacterized protein n=1 Tax=Polyangium jinanense TaxID=2829994 RepID=A0A9X3X208_9BACT|nr:hypothetical protein [Polyangium jinanense]MDC3954757.1 hypothetical protein [Polyangium jinanense]MDC3961895.1 hypothetical protein [Polyangium jinanense]MDC3981060.1 hypothetical protein [Polyangium jinanense]
MKPAAFLDYPVIDHLLRIDDGRYLGKHQAALLELRSRARAAEISLWMSEIVQVEMAHGQQNPRLTPEKRTRAEANDARKITIATDMGVRWLAYPCAKTNDEYTLLDISFRCAGFEWNEANTLEGELEQIKGISKGDARHLVSWIFGCDTAALDFHPTLNCFVSEDEPLREALLQFQPRAANQVLREAKILSVAEFVALVRT